MGMDCNEGGKLCPITEEILEAGERAFWKAINEERRRLHSEQSGINPDVEVNTEG